uniref:Acylglycerol kinase n=1 Tax=Erpetoichthys calabaricus TaxID=27687 RepID=A0A8C4X4T5_ERPCA
IDPLLFDTHYYEGQAKKLLDLMEPADLIIIAGGNGTLQEVITGLLRRTDEDVFSKIPIGFIPLGTTNTLSHTLFPPCDNKVKLGTKCGISTVNSIYNSIVWCVVFILMEFNLYFEMNCCNLMVTNTAFSVYCA